jgi:hypothetical protein
MAQSPVGPLSGRDATAAGRSDDWLATLNGEISIPVSVLPDWHLALRRLDLSDSNDRTARFERWSMTDSGMAGACQAGQVPPQCQFGPGCQNGR